MLRSLARHVKWFTDPSRHPIDYSLLRAGGPGRGADVLRVCMGVGIAFGALTERLLTLFIAPSADPRQVRRQLREGRAVA